MATRIWTQDMRKAMYLRLLKEFGPYGSWKGARTPKDSRYKEVLTELAVTLSTMARDHIKPGVSVFSSIGPRLFRSIPPRGLSDVE
jgi:hypothetical protein